MLLSKVYNKNLMFVQIVNRNLNFRKINLIVMLNVTKLSSFQVNSSIFETRVQTRHGRSYCRALLDIGKCTLREGLHSTSTLSTYSYSPIQYRIYSSDIRQQRRSYDRHICVDTVQYEGIKLPTTVQAWKVSAYDDNLSRSPQLKSLGWKM